MERAFVTGGSGFVGGHLLEGLLERDVDVVGLARSEDAATDVRDGGASVVRGDLADVETMAEAMADCDVAFHVAAKVDQWGPREAFEQVNVRGTENVVAAAWRADLDRLVHVGTEAVLLDGAPLVDVDETHPIPEAPLGNYARSKAEAERIVRAANGEDLTTVVVRPRFVWGPGEGSMNRAVVDAIRDGDFVWIEEGRYLTSTCHVHNAVEGLLLAARRGRGGEAYFVTDGNPVEFRSFVIDVADVAGVSPADRSVPRWLAGVAGRAGEVAWRLVPLPGAPPITRSMVAVIGQEVTVDDSKAREELGYEGRVSVEDGLEALRESADG